MQERLIIAAQASGAMNRAVEETVAYVKSRQAFRAQPVRVPEHGVRTRRVPDDRAHVRGVPRSLHPGAPARRTRRGRGAMAKYWLTDKQCEVVDRCVQLHGGYGYMREYLVARITRTHGCRRSTPVPTRSMKGIIAKIPLRTAATTSSSRLTTNQE
ncbi:hypothetical protein GS922_26055 [Rhodococcus hoagii]|nr:hypothetical protein [Prescottella equi]